MTNILFRTPYNLGDFNDDYVSDEPSMTDDTCYESLQSIIARCQRGEILLDHSPFVDIDEDMDAPVPDDYGADLTDIDLFVDALSEASKNKSGDESVVEQVPVQSVSDVVNTTEEKAE